ncbi:tumor protein p53-inducible protein 13 isoform X2 [Vanacampus margaritifer]
MPSRTVAVLAALWFCFGRHIVSEYLKPECDNGKLLVERDLPTDAIGWGCSVPAALLDSTQGLPSVATVYDPEFARQVCMNEPLSYHNSIPNSGAFRPVGAQSGEYLYCPPQRWLNNLHHGAAVLLYHPCAAFNERQLVSILARSCLDDYIVTPHPQLNKSMPIALVSWGRTLELSTAASSDVCDWLQNATTSSNQISGKYNFLLTCPAEQHGQKRTRREGRRTDDKEPVRQLCERIISLWLKGARKAEKGSPTNSNWQQLRGGSRQRRIRAAISLQRDDVKANGTFQVSDVLTNTKSSSTHAPRTHSLALVDPVKIQNQDFSSRPASHLAPTQRMLRLKVFETGRQTVKQTGSAKRSSAADGQTLENEVVDLRERELAQEGQRCACGKGAKGRATFVSLPSTPGSNEAVWAAAALGFLLVLLTLSVLHTRLYRHWRTMPSLYWHDPQQDYDSVADVIHRRLQIAKRRRKRGRRQECALLPSSSSSDEYM